MDVKFKTEIPHSQEQVKLSLSQTHTGDAAVCVQHFKCIHFQLNHTAELLLRNEKDNFEIHSSLASAHTGT